MTSAPKFNPNDDVRRVGSPRSKGIVRGGPYDRGSGPQYDVEWVLPQHGRGFVPEPDLEPFLAAAGPGWTGRGEFLSHLGLVKLVDPFTNVLLSMGWSRTEFHPCQFIPALQFVQHARHGLLIADEVGLGKTIEAALVLRELTARARMDRVLVVCPANLRSKWQGELSRRFDLKFDLLRGAEPEEILKRMQRDNVEPALRAIVSFESIRRGEDGPHPGGGGVRRAIEESGITFDLVIFDEARHMRNAPTRTARVAAGMREAASTAYGAALRDNPMFADWLRRLGRGKPLGPDHIIDLRRVLHDAHTLAPHYSRSRKRERVFHHAQIEYLKQREGACLRYLRRLECGRDLQARPATALRRPCDGPAMLEIPAGDPLKRLGGK